MRKNSWVSIIAVVAYCALIFYLSSLPGDSIPKLPVSDKVIHFFLYLGLGLLTTYFFFSLQFFNSRFRIIMITLGLVTLYGLSDEIHQLFVVGRNFEVLDLFVDIIGASSGSLIMSYLYPNVQRISLKFD